MLKNMKANIIIITGILIFTFSLVALKYCITESWATDTREECPVWDIQPPILCKSEKKSMYYGISSYEFLQICDDGTSVLWVMDTNKPIPVGSYSVENTVIHYFCFIEGRQEACDKFSEIIDKIVTCQERNRIKEN